MKLKNKTFLLIGMITIFMLGILTHAVASSSIQEIKAVTDHSLKIKLNGNDFNPTDNGIPIKPILYNGRTYLPVRAIGEAVGLPISWNANTRTVSIGTQNTTEQPVKNSVDFRNVSWGMSKAQVKKLETEEFTSGDDSGLSYNVTINNLDATLYYRFVDDKLIGAAYFIRETHSNPTDYISDYNNLKKVLTEKYGNPTVDEELWKDDLWKDDPNDWGMAVITGDLVYLAQWSTSSTEVSLILSGDNYEPNFAAMYQSKELAYLGEQDNNKNVLEALNFKTYNFANK